MQVETQDRQRRWEQWLALRHEVALDPDTHIADPHHHLWDRGGHTTYLPPQFAADVSSGHRVLSTVYVECRSLYHDSGPEQLRPAMDPLIAEHRTGISDGCESYQTSRLNR